MPDGVEWEPFWVRYAEFGETAIALIDGHVAGVKDKRLARYAVVSNTGPEQPCSARCGCGRDVNHRAAIFASNDLDEALTAFHEAEQKLIAGELTEETHA